MEEMISRYSRIFLKIIGNIDKTGILFNIRDFFNAIFYL